MVNYILNLLTFSMLIKIAADDILKLTFLFSQKIGHANCLLGNLLED